MNDYSLLFSLIKAYLKEIGYIDDKLVEYFAPDMCKELLVMKLASSNVHKDNRKNSNSHQTHIAVTGKAISFFEEGIDFNNMTFSESKMIDVCIFSKNLTYLYNNQELCKVSEDVQKGYITVGKRTQGQLQLSKKCNEDSENFILLRKKLNEDDLLVFYKMKSDDAGDLVYVLGIPKVFYEEIIPEYRNHFNATVYVKLIGEQTRTADIFDDNRCFQKKIDQEELCFEVYTEKHMDGNIVCYLCGCSLKQYIEKIPKNYQDNIIQRGIVKNKYLDRLVGTIVSNDNIPTITLVSDNLEIENGGKLLKLTEYRILDGLQRTYRLIEIWKGMVLFDSIHDKSSLIEMNKLRVSKEYAGRLMEEGSTLDVFMALINEYKYKGSIDRYWDYYNRGVQWFEIWENLSPKQETEKMLILNAGHKEVDIGHQIELLFINLLPKLNEICVSRGGIGIIRNREKDGMQYSKNRRKGEFYFPHIISALISYESRKPIVVNRDLVNRLQQDDYIETSDEIDYEYLEKVISFLLELDEKLYIYFGDEGTKWLAKETVLDGLFGALGKAGEGKELYDVFNEFISHVELLNISDFEYTKNNSVEINKVNLGSKTKSAIYNAVLDLLDGKIRTVEWKKYFGGEK